MRVYSGREIYSDHFLLILTITSLRNWRNNGTITMEEIEENKNVHVQEVYKVQLLQEKSITNIWRNKINITCINKTCNKAINWFIRSEINFEYGTRNYRQLQLINRIWRISKWIWWRNFNTHLNYWKVYFNNSNTKNSSTN